MQSICFKNCSRQLVIQGLQVCNSSTHGKSNTEPPFNCMWLGFSSNGLQLGSMPIRIA